ncbi:MAG: TetR family transcriptional regulator [Sporolactobacillus sp.]
MPKVSKEHMDKQKNKILDTALQIFIRKGFELTTMTDVIKASSLSRGGVYRYFSNTEEMMHAILDRNDEEGSDYIIHLTEENKNTWEALNRYIDEFEQDLNQTPKQGMMTSEYFISGWRNEPRRAYLQKRFARGKASLLYLFETGVKRGDFKPLQPIETIAVFVINICDGLILEAQLASKEKADIKGQIAAMRFYLKHILQIS